MRRCIKSDTKLIEAMELIAATPEPVASLPVRMLILLEFPVVSLAFIKVAALAPACVLNEQTTSVPLPPSGKHTLLVFVVVLTTAGE